MKPQNFYQILKEKDFGPFVGVPCSILAPFLEILNSKKELLIATSEGEAMGIASGFYLAGRSPVVFMQNSGLGNAINPLVSLDLTYRIPILLIITLRGKDADKDAPQHKIMGQKTTDFLKLLGIQYTYLTDDLEKFKKDLDCLKKMFIKSLKPAAIILRNGIFERADYGGKIQDNIQYGLTRRTAIENIAGSLNKDCLVITTTGKISREYYHCKNKPKSNFYMVGSMGCASAIGLGVALGVKDKKIVVIDGDGAVLMKLGNLATIGNLNVKNLMHIVLDNECHESTGGQKTASATIDLEKIAKDCGYVCIYKITKSKELRSIIEKVLKKQEPSFILVKICKTDKEDEKRLMRPEELPEQIKNNFMKQIKKT